MKSKTKFEFNARTIFLTYPKSTIPKEHLLERLREEFPIQDYSISIEDHTDGTPHLHAVLRFTSRVHTKDERAFDVEGFHPHIKTLKTTSDFTRTVKYVQKDGNYISNLIEKVTSTQQLAKDLIAEGLTPKFIFDHPEIIFKNYNSIKSFLNILPSSPPRGLSRAKRRHIWLHGPSNTGKTTWLRAVQALFTTAEIPENNDWGHLTSTVEILFADEYRGHLTVQQLNRVADGRTRLNTKGSSVSLQESTVVIVSNFAMRDVYKNVSEDIFDTLLNRFNQYDSSINLPALPKYIIDH